VKRLRGIVGLKSCTLSEVEDLIKDYQKEGYKVWHKTKNASGKLLSYNGVLELR